MTKWLKQGNRYQKMKHTAPFFHWVFSVFICSNVKWTYMLCYDNITSRCLKIKQPRFLIHFNCAHLLHISVTMDSFMFSFNGHKPDTNSPSTMWPISWKVFEWHAALLVWIKHLIVLPVYNLSVDHLTTHLLSEWQKTNSTAQINHP